MKALIIDDEMDICNLLSGLLVGKNLQSDSVNSISEAKLALEKHQPEIIFLDNHLPDGKGIDLVPYIKQQFPESVLVMITAYDSPADRNIAIAKGVDYFLPKPFTRYNIYETVTQVIN